MKLSIWKTALRTLNSMHCVDYNHDSKLYWLKAFFFQMGIALFKKKSNNKIIW